MADPIPTGIINQAPLAPVTAAAPTPPAVATTAQSTGYTANAFGVAPNQTVASNVKDIVAADSPLMQQAASRAAQQSNARGLLNSTQAISAGQSALYDAALPIAQQDANTYNAAATNTTNAQNTAAQFGATATNAASGLNAQLGTNTSQFNAGTVNAAETAKAAASNQSAMQNAQAVGALNQIDKQTQANLQTIAADGTVKLQVEQTTAAYKQLMQTSASAAQVYQQSMANLANIMTSNNVTDKASALQNGVKQLNEALALIGQMNNINLGSTLDFTNGSVATGGYVAPASRDFSTLSPAEQQQIMSGMAGLWGGG